MQSQSVTLTFVSLLMLLCFTTNDNFAGANALWLKIPTVGHRCVFEDIQNDVVVMGFYRIIKDDGNFTIENHPTTTATVQSPFGKTLHHKEHTTEGQFAFTTSEAGTYIVCFQLDTQRHNPDGVSLGLDWKIGIAAKDWDAVAKKEHIEGVELELKKAHSQVEAITSRMITIQMREKEMRGFNDKTNERVAWLSISSHGVCIFTAVLQLWNLKRYFHKKNLI